MGVMAHHYDIFREQLVISIPRTDMHCGTQAQESYMALWKLAMSVMYAKENSTDFSTLCFQQICRGRAWLGQIGRAGQRRGHAGGSLAPVGHHLDRQIHTIEYIALACTTVDSTRSALSLTVPYHTRSSLASYLVYSLSHLYCILIVTQTFPQFVPIRTCTESLSASLHRPHLDAHVPTHSHSLRSLLLL